jgi:predicted O-methyltransferase YrrM
LGSTTKVLKEIEKITDTQFLPIVGPEKGRILAELVHKVKPKRVLEVGTLIGYSAILIGRELDVDTCLTTIEIHAHEAEIAERNIQEAGIGAKVEVVVGDALKVIPKLKSKFDFVFIDADKTEYLQYLKLVEAKLHKGSVIFADNAGIFAEQMKDYLDYVQSSGKYTSKYIQVGEDGVEISVKN